MGSITNKEYYCPVCGWRGIFSTNYIGEIHKRCQDCENNMLYCKEDNLGGTGGVRRTVFYRFELSGTKGRVEDKPLRRYLISKYKRSLSVRGTL